MSKGRTQTAVSLVEFMSSNYKIKQDLQFFWEGMRAERGGELLPDNFAGDLKELDCDEIQTNYGGGRGGGTIARQLGRRLKGAGLSRNSDKLGIFQNVRLKH